MRRVRPPLPLPSGAALRPRGLALAWLAGAALTAGCGREAQGPVAKGGGPAGQVVAKVGDRSITVAELQEIIDRQDGLRRARYSTPERRKELLENLVRFEVLAQEARNRGLDRDPDVVRLMKQQMIEKLLRSEFEDKGQVEAISEAEIEAYYKAHAADFNSPPAVRVSQIFTREQAKATQAAAEARRLAPGDQQGFRDLVAKLSEDEDSRARGGDLTFLERGSATFPKSIVDAAFALAEVGDVSAPVKTDKGWHVLRMTQKRPGVNKSLTEVRRQIQTRLLAEKKAKKKEEWVEEMRRKLKVEVYEDRLAAIKVEPGPVENQPGAPALPPARK